MRHGDVRPLLLTSESVDVARGSGTAVAINRLRAALRAAGSDAPVMSARRSFAGATLARWRFNRTLSATVLTRDDAVLGVNGDGWRVACELRVPSIPTVIALDAGRRADGRDP